MTKFMEGPVRIRNDDGELVAAGYQWTEVKDGFHPLIVSLVFVSFVLPADFYLLRISWNAFVWLDSHVFNQYYGMDEDAWRNMGLLVGPIVAAIGIWFTLGPIWSMKFNYRKRAIIFHADGTLSAPYGWPYKKWFPDTTPSLLQLTSPIASIQSSKSDVFWPVNIYLADGERLLIEVTRSSDQSRELAVQLTRAHEELKLSKQRRPQTADVVIN